MSVKYIGIRSLGRILLNQSLQSDTLHPQKPQVWVLYYIYFFLIQTYLLLRLLWLPVVLFIMLPSGNQDKLFLFFLLFCSFYSFEPGLSKCLGFLFKFRKPYQLWFWSVVTLLVNVFFLSTHYFFSFRMFFVFVFIIKLL